MELIFHRGCNLHAPENSLLGIEEILTLTEDHAIELDVACTADAVAVVRHDLALDRALGWHSTLLDHDYPSLAAHLNLLRLTDLIASFPRQRLVLDLRSDRHPALFSGSSLGPDDLPQDPAPVLLQALRTALANAVRNNVRLSAGSVPFARQLAECFPGMEVEVSERGTREVVEHPPQDIRFAALAPTPRVYLRARALTATRVRALQGQGLEVFATDAFDLRSLDNSRKMLALARSTGANGLLASPLDSAMLDAARRC